MERPEQRRQDCGSLKDRLPTSAKISVVIPCYKVRSVVLDVISRIGPEVHSIYCVDDKCPQGSGHFIEAECPDRRVKVVFHEENVGVGGATLSGYAQATQDGADVIVKVDGDGQMAPETLPCFVQPIVSGVADYTKGNRFYNLGDHRGMPWLRLFGNSSLSFLTKFSSGYWNVFDPTNGYTAIHGAVAQRIVECSLAKRYFFESDMLYHLYMMRAVVVDVPIKATYGDEESSLKIARIFLPFIGKHISNTCRRILIQYFLRDFSVASLEIVAGILALILGFGFGVVEWIHTLISGEPATAGTVMLAALPIIVGVQLLLSALNYDVQNVPRFSIHHRLPREKDS